MARTTNWFDQNLGDWINDRVDDWRGSSRNQNAFDAAQKHFEARQDVLSSYNLPAGYEVNMSQRTWYGSETNISVRAPNVQEAAGEKNNENESAFQQQQAAVGDVLSKYNSESAQDAAEKMTQQEIHGREHEGQEIEREQSRTQEKEQEQAHDHER